MTGIRNLPKVREAYVYITRPAILKSKEEIHGIILRGIDSSYSASFFRQHLVDGTFPDYRGEGTSNEIVLSASVASLLGLKTGDRVASHFVQDQPRVRMFTVAGIYDTGFKEYDDIMVPFTKVKRLGKERGIGDCHRAERYYPDSGSERESGCLTAVGRRR